MGNIPEIIAFGAAFTAGFYVNLTAFAVWCAKSKRGIFFAELEEGTGITTVRGEEYERTILAWKGYKIDNLPYEVLDDKGDPVLKDGEPVYQWRETIVPGQEVSPKGYLGFLQRHFKIRYIGMWPMVKQHKSEFRWSEWQKDEQTGVETLKPRKELTSFFYAKTFGYGIRVPGAETGSRVITLNGQEIQVDGGNLSVDLGIAVLIRVRHPRIALFDNEDWFEQLEAVLVDHARLYVGGRSFDDLRSQKESGDSTEHEFSKYMLKLNEHAPIGGKFDSVIDALGIEIFGAQIKTVDLTDASAKEVAATRAVFVAEQERQAKDKETAAEKNRELELGAAKAINIERIGKAEAAALREVAQVAAESDAALFVLRQNTLAKAGEKGNLVIAAGGGSDDTLTTAAVQAHLTAKALKGGTPGATPGS